MRSVKYGEECMEQSTAYQRYTLDLRGVDYMRGTKGWRSMQRSRKARKMLKFYVYLTADGAHRDRRRRRRRRIFSMSGLSCF